MGADCLHAELRALFGYGGWLVFGPADCLRLALTCSPPCTCVLYVAQLCCLGLFQSQSQRWLAASMLTPYLVSTLVLCLHVPALPHPQAKDGDGDKKESADAKEGEKKEEKKQPPPPKPQPPPPSIALQACRLGKQLLEPHAYSLSSEYCGQQLQRTPCCRFSQLIGWLVGHSRCFPEEL